MMMTVSCSLDNNSLSEITKKKFTKDELPYNLERTLLLHYALLHFVLKSCYISHCCYIFQHNTRVTGSVSVTSGMGGSLNLTS